MEHNRETSYTPEKLKQIDEYLQKRIDFKKELTALINKYSFENNSNTPDFIIADYLFDCLMILTDTVKDRDNFFKPVGEKPENPELLK